jgi:hypothetical protein
MDKIGYIIRVAFAVKVVILKNKIINFRIININKK